MNVGTYNGMSISLLLFYVNIPLSFIFPPMSHTHLSLGASSWTVYQFLADLVLSRVSVLLNNWTYFFRQYAEIHYALQFIFVVSFGFRLKEKGVL